MPLFHLNCTWSLVSGVLSLIWNFAWSGAVVSLQLGFGPMTHPLPLSQVWQSGQVCGAPDVQTPLWHVSGVVQTSLSSHGEPSVTKVQSAAQQEPGWPLLEPSS